MRRGSSNLPSSSKTKARLKEALRNEVPSSRLNTGSLTTPVNFGTMNQTNRRLKGYYYDKANRAE